jgi:hypothetical protein
MDDERQRSTLVVEFPAGYDVLPVAAAHDEVAPDSVVRL